MIRSHTRYPLRHEAIFNFSQTYYNFILIKFYILSIKYIDLIKLIYLFKYLKKHESNLCNCFKFFQELTNQKNIRNLFLKNYKI